jgi:diphosphomevalonate decarboxylase
LVKYWGKHGHQLPLNPSLSMTLKKSFTETSIIIQPADSFKLHFKLDGISKPAFFPKIEHFINSLSNHFQFLHKMAIEINSYNSFPHSTGIASSASSMSALALGLTELIEKQSGNFYLNNDFLRKASFLSRMASGSASRSVYGFFSVWGETKYLDNTSDNYAIPLKKSIHPVFENLQDTILIVDPLPKKVSSTSGHQQMNQHIFKQARIQQAHTHLKEILTAMETGDTSSFIRITESEALTLHALMMTSPESYMLLHPNTIKIIQEIIEYRKKTNIFVTFTLDAGPNVHVIYPNEEKIKVMTFINEKLKHFCHNQYYIDDKTGTGPVKTK